MFDLTASSIGYIKAGQLRALAVTTVKRSEALPELPTVGDFVPGYEASAVGGFGAPKGTPVEIIQKLNVEINAGSASLPHAASAHYRWLSPRRHCRRCRAPNRPTALGAPRPTFRR
jgi:tripartite-type tricarboxylate transporter receptor subunit TctC